MADRGDIVAVLASLKTHTNEILAALDREEVSGDAINFGDLSCTEASFVITDTNDEYRQVLIEEASPDCRKLPALMRQKLADGGFGDVQVVTEW